MHTLALAARLGPAVWIDLLRAVHELAIARYRLGSRAPQELLLHARAPGSANHPHRSSPDIARLVDRVAYVVPRAAARVPWRADCLVQALAAQRWLGRKRIPTTFHIGLPTESSDEFEAHAWLKHGEIVVTGGDLSGFVPLERDEHLIN